MHGSGAYASASGIAGDVVPQPQPVPQPVPVPVPQPVRAVRGSPGPDTVRPGREAPVIDLRSVAGPPGGAAGDGADQVDGVPGGGPRELRCPAGDLLVVSGIPGSGKSTLIRRTVTGADQSGAAVRRVDSQDTRDRWERRLPGVPYGLYRPLVRLAHYAVLRRALRSGDSVVVHDCGTLAWVRRWLARDARRRGRALHLLLLDVPPAVALAGQVSRGRGVSGYAFGRHRQAVARLVGRAEAGQPPDGCTSVVLLDRTTSAGLQSIVFE